MMEYKGQPCPECGEPLPSAVVCNIHGMFCSKPCVRAATHRGYAKRTIDPAAASDLLAACEAMLAVYAPVYRPTEATDAFSDAVIKARAAVAKARGATPAPAGG